MARVFIVLPGGKVKRITNHKNGHCHDGKDFYGEKRLPRVIRDRLAREAAAQYCRDEVHQDKTDANA